MRKLMLAALSSGSGKTVIAAALSLALQEKGLITQKEYRRIEPILVQKFSPVWAAI